MTWSGCGSAGSRHGEPDGRGGATTDAHSPTGADAGSGSREAGTSDASSASEQWQWSRCGDITPTSVAVGAVAYSPVGEEILAAYADGRVLIHSVDDPAVPDRVLEGPGSPAVAVAFSPDGAWIAEAKDAVVTLRRVQDGQPTTPELERDAACEPRQLSVSPDGRRVLGWRPAMICVWDTGTGAVVAKVSEHFLSAVVTNDRIVASNPPTTALPAAVTFFSLPTLTRSVRLLDGLAPGMPTVDALLLSPTGDAFAATVREAATPRLILWSADGAVIASVQVPESNRMAFSPDGRHVLLGSRLLDASTGLPERDAVDPVKLDNPVMLNAAGTRAVVSTDSSWRAAAIVYDVGTGNELRVLTYAPVPGTYIFDLAVSPDGKTLAFATATDVWMFQLGAEFARSKILRSGREVLPIDLHFSEDGLEFLASGDGWYLQSSDGQLLGGGSPDDVSGLGCQWSLAMVSPKKTWLAIGAHSALVEIHRYDDLSLVANLPAERCDTMVAFSHDQTLMATSGPELYRTSDWTRVWPSNLPTPTSIGVGDGSFGKESPFEDVQFAPGEKQVLVSACGGVGPQAADIFQCAYTLYSVQTGALVRRLAGLDAQRAYFSAEGDWIVSGKALLHLPTGQLRTLDPDARVAAFAPNGDIIAALSDQSLVRYCRDTRAAATHP